MATKRQNNIRRYTGPGPRSDLSEIRKKEAIERKVAWDTLTVELKLQLLDQRLGKDVGAVKQRAKLEMQLSFELEKKKASNPKKLIEQVIDNKQQKLKAKDRRVAEQKNTRDK